MLETHPKISTLLQLYFLKRLKEAGLAQYISIVLLARLVSFNPNTRKLTFRDQSKSTLYNYISILFGSAMISFRPTADPPLSTPLSQIAPVLNNNRSLRAFPDTSARSKATHFAASWLPNGHNLASFERHLGTVETWHYLSHFGKNFRPLVQRKQRQRQRQKASV